MTETRLSIQWDHTAAICSAIYNSRMGIKKNQLINAEKLNPYRIKKTRRGGKIRISDMARGFGVS